MATRKIRVLVVDDSSTMRRIITDVLSADHEIEVVGTAANGKLALEKLAEVRPEIMTLDIEMPELDGLQTVPLVRKVYPTLPIIMFSSLTEEGATQTLQALKLGATDFLAKPTAHTGPGGNVREVVASELVRKIKALTGHGSSPSVDSTMTGTGVKASAVQLPRAEVVAIGVSTGGPNALAEIFPLLPADLRTPILIVQHMPPLFTKVFADLLQEQSTLKIVEAEHGMAVASGCVYVAPGDFHMEIKRVLDRTIISLNQNAPENSCRPAVDVLFRSVASVFASRALAVVLTGMGQDGLKGSQRITEAGGSVIAQDQATSSVWGMPGSVVQAGLASIVLPVQAIAHEIIRRTNFPGAASMTPLSNNSAK